MIKRIKKIPASTRALIKNTIASLDKPSQKEILVWLHTVRLVKNDPKLTKKEKEKQLVQLKPSDALMTFLNALVDLIIHKVPIKNKKILKAGVSGLGLAASLMSFRRLAIALFLFHKTLPKFVMTDTFDDLSDFLIEELE